MDRNKHQRSNSYSTGPVAHSTPSKESVTKALRFADPPDGASGEDMADGNAPPPPRFQFRRDLPSQSNSSGGVSDIERDTIIKQRTELQLMIGELKDRDRELNEMVHAHQQQMAAWEEDRQRGQNLEQRVIKLDRDLHKRNSQIRELLKKLKLVETEALSTSSALDETRDQLNSLAQQHSQTCTQLHELEEYNTSLQKSFRDVSQTLGETEAKVTKMKQLIEMKEKEAIETNKEMDGLSSRLQSLEHSYKHLESITFDVKNSANEWKNKYNEMKQVADSMKGELSISNATLEERDEEFTKYRQELNEKVEELNYVVEREKRKDQLLELQKSKQERTDRELSTLRQMYELQQHKLATLRKELTESREKEIKHRVTFDLNGNDGDGDAFDLSDSYLRSPHGSPIKSPSQKSSPYHSPEKRQSPQKRIKSPEIVSLHTPSPSSTDRLQKLLNDSKRLVETITTNDSNSPTHSFSKLSLSNASSKQL